MNQRAVMRFPISAGAAGLPACVAALRAVLHTDTAPLGLVPAGSAPHERAMAAAVEADAPVAGDEAGVILPTSGATGEPRGVVLGRAGLRAAARLSMTPIGPPGLWLAALPLTSIGGLMCVVRAAESEFDPVAWPGIGGAERFTPESFAATAQETVLQAQHLGVPAYTSLVPTQLTRVLRSGTATDALAGFRRVLVGGAALSPRTRAIAESRGIKIMTTYGATETCGGVIYDGAPLAEVDVTITEAGTIAVGGPTLALGYRFRPDLDREHFVDGRFLTADLGRWRDGHLDVLGRSDNVIKVGGVKVSTTAVTEALLSHPRVLDALTVAVPNAEWGLVPTAYVVLDDPIPEAALAAMREELSDLVSERCGRAARPREIVVGSELPQLPSGKAGIFGGKHPSGRDSRPT
ncbi:MAG: AMP-binding protein [Actinomycetia bacterium]|nr:AMP-binding protein [Actinomycetes bacterium]